MSDQPNKYPGALLPKLADKPAVIMAESGSSMSYSELDAYANRLGRVYQWLGLRSGDHVAYIVENRLECIAIQWAAHYVGLYYTFISTRLTASEAAYIVDDCDAKVLIVSGSTSASVIEAVQSLPTPPNIFSLDGRGGVPLLEDELYAFDPAPIKDTLEGSEMLYSSGTTGKPKGVKPAMTGLPLGSTSVIAGLLQKGFGVDTDAVYLSTAPHYHAAPMKWGQGITTLGGTVVMMEKFDAEEALKAIETYEVTHSQWVPTMFHRLLALPDDCRQRYDLSSHKVAVHAAAPCPIATKRAMIDWWGPIIFEYYSCTEGIGMTFTDSHAWLERPGTVGRALMGIPHIVDEHGGELPPGKEGLIYFSDGTPFSYHKDQVKTDEAYNEQRWATVGDIGYLDAEGFLYLTDRKSNMIISGGVNVYPQETENVLITHPKVFDVAVIGVPHPDFGEEVCAVVQLESNVTGDENLVEELQAYCREQLSSIKCPRKIDFRSALPREPNGKLLKRLLVDEYRKIEAKR